MSWAPVLVGGDRRVYVSPDGSIVELPREAERFRTREGAMQRAIEVRDQEESRQAEDGWVTEVDAEEVE